MNFLHTSFPGEPEEGKEGGVSDDALDELDDGLDDEADDMDDGDDDRVAYDLHDDRDDY